MDAVMLRSKSNFSWTLDHEARLSLFFVNILFCLIKEGWTLECYWGPSTSFTKWTSSIFSVRSNNHVVLFRPWRALVLFYYLLDTGQWTVHSSGSHLPAWGSGREDTRSVGRGGNLPRRSPPPHHSSNKPPTTAPTALCRSPLPVSFRRPLWRPWLIVSGSRQFAAQSVARPLPIHHIAAVSLRLIVAVVTWSAEYEDVTRLSDCWDDAVILLANSR